MNPVDEMAAKVEATGSTDTVVGSDRRLVEHASVDGFQRTGDQRKPVEDLQNLLLRISHHLDYETSERSTIYYRLLAIDGQTKRIENQTKGRVLRTLVRYLVAICIGVAGTLAWQSYGEATKQIIATRAPELGWSPESKQMIASFVQQLGWTKPPAGSETIAVQPTTPGTLQPTPVAQTVIETAAPKAPPAPALDPEQVQEITRGLTTLQQTVEQLAATQDQMEREITKLQTADFEILQRIPTPPPRATLAPTTLAPTRKPLPAPRALSPAH